MKERDLHTTGTGQIFQILREFHFMRNLGFLRHSILEKELGNHGKVAREKDVDAEHDNSLKKYKMKATRQQ